MIRPYEPRDLDELLEAWYQAARLAHPFLNDDFFETERQNIIHKYTPVVETWVYEQTGHVVGFIALLGNEVGALFLLPACHGNGIGRALMDHARKLRGTLEVDVFKENHIGRTFYDRYGFVPIKEHLHGETGHTLVRMRLTEPLEKGCQDAFPHQDHS